MLRKWIVRLQGLLMPILLALALLLLAGTAVIAATRLTEHQVQNTVAGSDELPPERERDSSPDVPAITFIDSPAPTCYRPVVNTDTCFIEWQYLSVSTGSSDYIITMTVSIDGQMRAYFNGFFQNSMFVPATMASPGYQVVCGVPGSGGVAELGSNYSYTLRARDSQGLGSANYGSVTCPVGLYKTYLPVIQRP